jgi:hypothetical protein
LQAAEALHHQPRAGEQHERERDLRHHERAPQPPAPRALPAGTLAALLQSVVEVQARRFERRGDAEDDAGQERDGQRPAEHREVDADALEAHEVLRADGDERPDAPPRDEQAEEAAEQREQQALRE